MNWLTRQFPFNREQTINLLGEVGPLVAFFVVNGIAGITAGTWSLIITTLLALLVSLTVLGRPPVMPFIAGAVSIVFGFLTLYTGNAMWVQIKVTLFNSLVAGLLAYGLRSGRNFFQLIFGKSFHYSATGWYKLTRNVAWFFLFTAIVNEIVRQGFDGVEVLAWNKVLKGIDIWVMFKLFIVMPLTAVFFWWQVRLMQKYRLSEATSGGSRHIAQ